MKAALAEAQVTWKITCNQMWRSLPPPVCVEYAIAFVPPSCCVYDIDKNYIDLVQCQTFVLGPPGKPSGEVNTALFYQVSETRPPLPTQIRTGNIPRFSHQRVYVARASHLCSRFNGWFHFEHKMQENYSKVICRTLEHKVGLCWRAVAVFFLEPCARVLALSCSR